MGQSEVIDLLKKIMKPMSRTQIAKELDAKPAHISVILSKLVNSNEVDFKEIDRFKAEKFYNVKRRMRIFFLVD